MVARENSATRGARPRHRNRPVARDCVVRGEHTDAPNAVRERHRAAQPGQIGSDFGFVACKALCPDARRDKEFKATKRGTQRARAEAKADARLYAGINFGETQWIHSRRPEIPGPERRR